MAYAALVSLVQTIDRHFSLYDQYEHPLRLLPTKDKLVLLNTKITTILAFVEQDHHSHRCRDAIDLLENRIIDVAYKAEDLIQSHSASKTPCKRLYFMPKFWPRKKKKLLPVDFEIVLGEIDLVLKDVMEIQKNFTSGDLQKSTYPDSTPAPGTSSFVVPPIMVSSNISVVGLDQDFDQVKALIYQHTSKLLVIPIVGMGGMGKTTLATRLYEDSISAQYFDRFAWLVVSQQYSLRDLLLGVLKSITQFIDELYGKNDAELALIIHKELTGRRYLIVIDDVWSNKSWDDLRKLFPDNDNGSRILVTTRLFDVASYVESPSGQLHEMRFLEENQSWILLQQQVFAHKSCPPHLEKIGKKIAKTCQGLPLTIVVVAGLLKEDMREEYWMTISQNISSMEPTIEQKCSKVLSLSYDHLPPHLKPCFLYMAAFPEDIAIDVDRIMRLWVAEGFVRPSGSKCFEEEAEGYLDDLVGRNLLLANKKRSNGKIRTIMIHDLWRDICTVKATEKKFLYHSHSRRMDAAEPRLNVMTGEERRVSVFRTDEFFDALREHNHKPTTRSLILFPSSVSHIDNYIQNFMLLRIFDAPSVIWDNCSANIAELANLTYLVFASTSIHCLPASIYNLRNLQTLIYHALGVIDFEIWRMPQLRHLVLLEQGYLVQSPSLEIVRETDLQTLSLVTNLKFTDEVVKMLANVRKLGLHYGNIPPVDGSDCYLYNLVRLTKLEILKIINDPDHGAGLPSIFVDLAFPPTLKKLTLEGYGIPWKDMSKIGCLPNLEVLKLKWYAVKGTSWYPTEGEFPRLKYLEIWGDGLREWEVDHSHFPSLQRLILKHTGWYLQKIPSGIGEIPALKLIELHRCAPSIVASAMEIKEEQHEMANDDLQVRVYDNILSG